MPRQPDCMWFKKLLFVGLCFCVDPFNAANAGDPGSTNPLSGALAAWRQGDLSTASALLTSLTETGSRDARIWYYRGSLAEQMGQDGTADFQEAARLETAQGSTRLVNRALENIQGPLRSKIEAIREQARAAARPDPVAAQNTLLYRDAVNLLQAGHVNEATQRLDQAIGSKSDDPRVYYMRGIVSARAGNPEEAQTFFRQALQYENSADRVRSVNLALQDVQGSIRQMIEEQVFVGDADQKISRQSNQRVILELEAQQRQRLLAFNTDDQQSLTAEASEAQRALEVQAAERILAEEKQRAAAEALLNSPAEQPSLVPTAPEPNEPLPAVEPQSTTPAPNPFGAGSTPVAEAPDASSPAPAVNPFLSGAAPSDIGSAASAAPIDFSWLAPNSEMVLFARPGDMMNSRFMAPVMQLPQVQQGLQTMVQQAGFSATDIESVTYGMGDVMAQVVAAAMPGAAGGPPNPQEMAQKFSSNPTAISVVRLTRDIDISALEKAPNATPVQHGDRTYHLTGKENPAVPRTAVCVIDPRTWLFATEGAMKAALDRGPGSAVHPQFAFMSQDSQLVFAFSNPALAAMSGSIPPAPPDAPPFVQQLLDAVKGRVSGICIAMKTTADLNLQVQLVLNDASSGSNGLAALQDGVEMLKQLYPVMMRTQVPAKLQSVTDTAIASTQAGFSDPLLSVSITVPGQLVTILQESPELLGPMMPPGGVPGAGPGFGDPSQGFGATPADASQGFGPPATPSTGNPFGTPPADASQGFGVPTPDESAAPPAQPPVADPSAGFGIPPAGTPGQ